MEPTIALRVRPGGVDALRPAEGGTWPPIATHPHLGAALAAARAGGHGVVIADEGYAPRTAVLGVVGPMSAQSGMRAACLAGLDVGVVLCVDDGRTGDERLAALLAADVDLVLLVGGTDAGEEAHVVRMAELVARASRFLARSRGGPLDVVFAGNADAVPAVQRVLGEGVVLAENVRPSLEEERLEPAVRTLASLAAHRRGRRPTAPAAAARALALRHIAERRGDALLVREGEGRVEVLSHLGGHWNRTWGATLADAVVAHRAWARELAGVALEREIADAFTPGYGCRDLLDVRPPREIWCCAVDRAPPGPEGVEALLDAVRPRGIGWVAWVDERALTLAGLHLFDGDGGAVRDLADGPATATHRPAPLGVFAALDGPGAPVRVEGAGLAQVVGVGRLDRFVVACGAHLHLAPFPPGDLGGGPGRAVRLPVEGGTLWLDTRGTPVPPPRRRRMLPS